MKNSILVCLLAIMVIGFDSCASQKYTIPERTLAQICADSFPRKDSIQLIECEVEIEKTNLVYIDTTKCPPSDTGKTIVEAKTITVPGRTVKTVVMVPSQIDSALRVAYKDLQVQYSKSIQDLKDCQARVKEKAKPRADWKVWLMALGLLIVVLIQLFNRKN